MFFKDFQTNKDSPPFKIAGLMKDFPQNWGICGGWAIDLFIGSQTRQHKDIDIAILRRHQLEIYKYLSTRNWKIEKAHNGNLIPVAAYEFIELPVHGIWCKNDNYEPNFLEILLNEADKDYFYFRRDFSIKLKLKRTFIQTESKLPVLAPEIVLLYKSKYFNQEFNQSDFEKVLPFLNTHQKEWLKKALEKISPGHIWLKDLS